MDDSDNCIAYYALQVGRDAVPENSGLKGSYVGVYDYFPAIELTFLGVQREYQRQGIGEYLLMDAFQKVAEVAKNVGFFAMTVLSADKSSDDFYKSLQFEPYSEHNGQQKLLYPIQDILTLVGLLKLE